MIFVEEGESGRSVASEGGSEPIEDDIFGVPLELFSEEFFEVILGDIGFSFVKYVEQNLSPGEEFVDSHSSGPDSDGHK